MKVRLKSTRKKDEMAEDWEECLEVDIRVEEEVKDSTSHYHEIPIKSMKYHDIP